MATPLPPAPQSQIGFLLSQWHGDLSSRMLLGSDRKKHSTESHNENLVRDTDLRIWASKLDEFDDTFFKSGLGMQFYDKFLQIREFEHNIKCIWWYICQIWAWNAILLQVFADVRIWASKFEEFDDTFVKSVLECSFITGFWKSVNLSTKLAEFVDTFVKFELGMQFCDRFFADFRIWATKLDEFDDTFFKSELGMLFYDRFLQIRDKIGNICW